MINDAVYTEEIDGFRLSLYSDQDAESPLDWEEFVSIAFFHSRYDYSHGLGKDFRSPEDYYEFAKETPVIALPLFMYDHSGITFNTGGFSCPWDSGQVGYVFVTLDAARKEFGWKHITKQRREKILDVLRGTVETLDQYVTGDVYGYVISQVDEDLEDWEDEEGEHIDSCWGFYGYDYALEEAKSTLDYIVRKHSERTFMQNTAIGL